MELLLTEREHCEKYKVPVERLRWNANPNEFPPICTYDIVPEDPIELVKGQEDAKKALWNAIRLSARSMKR